MDIPKERPANADESLVNSEIAVNTVASIVVLVSIILRFTGRWILEQRAMAGKGRSNSAFGLDDVFSILATICFFGLVTAVSIAIKRGMGTHVQVILYERGFQGLTEYNQAIFVSSIFYNSVLGLIKLSVLALYSRILRGVQGQTLNRAVWILATIVAANTIANVCVCIVQCWPIQAAWDVTIPANKKRCVDINAFYLGNAITGVITDALVYFLSIPIVKPLQMDTKLKLQLLATMLVGGFAVITSAVRLGFIPSLLKDPDVSMAMGIPMNWSVAEPAVGILVSSMPAIRAIRFLWRKPGDDSYGSGYGQSSLRSRHGQMELHDVSILETKTDLGSAKTRDPDNDSEEQLVVVGNRHSSGKITRTTHLDVKYSGT